MEQYLPENEYREFEGRVYSNPQIYVDEGNKFIDNLRSTQGQQNQQIAQQTGNLGTNVPTNLGGLGGNNSYFTSRYQTPQTNSNIANLRASAQAKALNDVLANEQAIWKKRYQDAYKKYQKSAYDKSNPTTTTQPDIDEQQTTEEITNVQTEGLILNMYKEKLQKYINEGYTIEEAEAKVKADMGLSN